MRRDSLGPAGPRASGPACGAKRSPARWAPTSTRRTASSSSMSSAPVDGSPGSCPSTTDWAAEVLEVARESGERPFFQPDRTRIHPGPHLGLHPAVLSHDGTAKFKVQRLRITWIVGHLSAGTHLVALEQALGWRPSSWSSTCVSPTPPTAAAGPPPAGRADLTWPAVQTGPLVDGRRSGADPRARGSPCRRAGSKTTSSGRPSASSTGPTACAPSRSGKSRGRSGPGGRPETFPVRALLVAMLVCAMTDQPMLATRFTDVLFRQISPTMRHALGVPKPPGPATTIGLGQLLPQRPHPISRPDRPDGPLAAPKNRRLDPEPSTPWSSSVAWTQRRGVGRAQ